MIRLHNDLHDVSKNTVSLNLGEKLIFLSTKLLLRSKIVDFLRYCIYSYLICIRLDEIRMVLNVEIYFKKC